MPTKITMIGLGQTGKAMGLALATHRQAILRIGHDLRPEQERAALQHGAVDKAEHHLPAAARGARIIALALPAAAVRETLEYISQDVEDGAVILDTSPIKVAAAEWARQILPKSCGYVGLTPALNPLCLHETIARADLFTNAACLVAPAPHAPEGAVRAALDFVSLLGARPLLTDIHEADGLTAATHLLPQILSAALTQATANQPGWADARKVASRVYSEVSGGISQHDDADSLALAARLNLPAMQILLARAQEALNQIESDLAAEDESALRKRIGSAREENLRWLGERLNDDWSAAGERPAPASLLSRLLNGLTKKKK